MKRVLCIVPFEQIYPPMNGGMLRSINLMHQLSKQFHLTAIILQDTDSFLKATVDYPGLRKSDFISVKDHIYQADLFSFLPLRLQRALRYRYWNQSIEGPAENNFLRIYPVLKKLLQEKQFDYVILEDMCLLNIVKLIRKYQPKAHVIYDAYNVNTRLEEASLTDGMRSQKNYRRTKEAESNLYGLVDDVFTCSKEDFEQLREMNGGKLTGRVVPNGVTIPKDTMERNMPLFSTPTQDILFCGSLDYFPNQEGLSWFCNEVLPLVIAKNPACRLMVVGKGQPGVALLSLLDHASVIFYGMVDKVSDYYQKAAVAIVPLLSGSGTRLKLLEAMGNRVAVVSTAIGAEGISYTDHRNILIANEPATFADALIKLLNEKETAAAMATQAYEFVKKEYDWDIIGENLFNFLNTNSRTPKHRLPA